MTSKLNEIAHLIDNIVEQKLVKYGVDKVNPKQLAAQVRAQVKQTLSKEKKLSKRDVNESNGLVSRSLNFQSMSSRKLLLIVLVLLIVLQLSEKISPSSPRSFTTTKSRESAISLERSQTTAKASFLTRLRIRGETAKKLLREPMSLLKKI